MLNNILAKKDPDEELTKHINNTVNIWERIRECYSHISFLDQEFWKYSLLTVLFHDAGKISNNFQELDYRNKNYLRHEFISGMILLALDLNFFENNSLPIWAIFSHHKSLNDNLFFKETNKEIFIQENTLSQYFEFVETIFKNYFNTTFYQNFKYKTFILNKDTNYLYLNFKNKFFQTFKTLTKKDRKIYIFYKAILNQADWLASGHQFINTKFEYDIDYLRGKIIRSLIKQKKIVSESSFTFRDFQINSNTKKNVIARAPTGSGKTEASLIWSSNKSKYSRIFYLLPTKVTSNAIYSRLKNYFGENNTAVVHSSAFLFQKEEHIDDYSYLEYLKDKTFFKNISVCTIDQILTQGFNLGYWELKTFHQFNSKIIIDEVHLYEPYTLGLIIATIKYLKNEFGATFFLMSATMPSKLKELLTKTLDKKNTKFVYDKEFLQSARNKFIVTEKKVDKFFSEIIDKVKNGIKVLLVINTVNEAIRLYEELNKSLSNFKVMCYHSKFIVKDRFEKEQTLSNWEDSTEGCLLISTQVVEVSLDIDYDILYTENAPIDAIVQRAGRVNRKRNKKETKIIVFPHSEIAEKYVYNTKNILQDTFTLLKKYNKRRLTEKELIDVVDEIYENFNLEDEPEYKNALKIYEEIQEQNHFIKDVSADEKIFTRQGLDTVEVIPMTFFEELSNKSKQVKSKYLVSIRKPYLNYNRKEIDDDKFIYLDIKYSYEKGIEFNKKDNSMIFI